MAKRARGKGASAVVWVLMGLLILGLGGFGVTSFSGSVRSIGSVGEVEIDVNDYARALTTRRDQLSAQMGRAVRFQEMQEMQEDARVRAELIATAALDEEARRRGLSVGDAEVHRRILEIPAFQGVNGAFDREAYAFTLRQNGLTEATFETALRSESARSILTGAVVGGVEAPAAFVDRLADWIGETRSFTHAELIAADLPEPLPEPSEAELRAHYEANPADYTRPEVRVLTYAWLSPEIVMRDLPLDEEALRVAYEQRIGEFVTPERRLVERLVFATEAEAEAARARIEAGETTLVALAEERGLSAADIDLGEQAEADLGVAGPAIFALEEPGVVGPVQTDLGPALYAMNAILMAQETSFEEARETLSEEVAAERARRVILDRADALEDLLAGGATLEQLAEETEMELGRIEMEPDTAEGIAGYTAFREAAQAAQPGDFASLAELEDGGIFALRLDEVREPQLKPFEEVRAEVAEGWRAAETRRRLAALAAELLAQLENGAALESLGLVVTRHTAVARNAFLESAPPGLVDTAFGLEAEGAAAVIDAGQGVHLVRLDAVIPADPAEPEMQGLRRAIETQAAQGLALDLADAFTMAIQSEAGIFLDQTAINAVHAQIQ